jgi:hypothetical protein
VTRTISDLSGIVAPGDRIYVAWLEPDGTPTGLGYAATVDKQGRYDGQKAVTKGLARVETINRPGKGSPR